MATVKRVCKLIVTIEYEQDIHECPDATNAKFIATNPIHFIGGNNYITAKTSTLITGQVEDEDGKILATHTAPWPAKK